MRRPLVCGMCFFGRGIGRFRRETGLFGRGTALFKRDTCLFGRGSALFRRYTAYFGRCARFIGRGAPHFGRADRFLISRNQYESNRRYVCSRFPYRSYSMSGSACLYIVRKIHSRSRAPWNLARPSCGHTPSFSPLSV